MTHSPALLAVPLLVVGLSGCAAAAPAAEDGVLRVVASTDVWGSIAEAVGGDRIEVTSIIDGPGQDPHEYEASARDQLAVSRADVVVENGGGYDPFLRTLIDASGADPVVIDAVEVSGLAPEDEHEDEHSDDGHGHVEGFNEHLWYDLSTAQAVAQRLTDALSDLDPAGAGDYTERLASFGQRVDRLEQEASILHDRLAGDTVLVTEPVPLHLLAALGLEDLTPPELPEAVEEDTDVAPAVLQQVLALVGSGDVDLVAYNEQTSTGQTERILEAARSAGVPVVAFAETLPEGAGDYLDWMGENIRHVAEALA